MNSPSSATLERPTVTVRQSPDQTSENDRAAQLRRVDQLSRWLDNAVRVPGTDFRVGYDTIIGLIPGVGDLATMAMSGWIINEARQLGVSKFTLARMVMNTGIDAIVGTVPLVGDLFDATFKANAKNVRLLKRSLEKRGIILDNSGDSGEFDSQTAS